MTNVTHLRSLQALEMAIRLGSLKEAAEALGITPAAVGQRIRILEDYLGTDLLLRGRSGLSPTEELNRSLDDLKLAFATLERVTESLDFRRIAELQIVADPDWADLWLKPRLKSYQEEHPNLLFCINGEGDIPMRLGNPDLRIEYADPEEGEELFRDRLLPIVSPHNLFRMESADPEYRLEGMAFLHVRAQHEAPDRPGWRDWVNKFGHRRDGVDRGVRYRNTSIALEAVRQKVGFLLCGRALAEPDIVSGEVTTIFPTSESLLAPKSYVLKVQRSNSKRPQLLRFVAWLKEQAEETRKLLAATEQS